MRMGETAPSIHVDLYARKHIDKWDVFWYYQITISRFDTMLRDFFLGFIKIHVLHHAAHGPIYGVGMIAELARHGYDLSPGTLYPLLHGLEEQGYLAREDRVVEGRVRKYYVITEEGSAALQEAKQKIAELVHEVLEEVDDAQLPEGLPFSDEEAEEG
jgi:DNA-binding PadR family transcriptional regulator